MPTHAEQRVLPYSAEQLYGLVADIERYPEFLPWCVAVRIRKREDAVLHADMAIGFKMFRETFTSRVTLMPPNAIDVAYVDGPFRYLDNHWRFVDQPGGGCLIDFYVDFEFRSALLQRVIGVLFGEAVRRLVAAFEARARQLHGGELPTGHAGARRA